MVKEIITDAVALSTWCEEIDIKQDRALLTQIILDLKQTIREKNLIALSANQIGYNKRVIVVNFKGNLQTFINPIISNYRKPTWAVESCSSVPDKEYLVLTFDEIDIFYQTPLEINSNGRLRGLAAKAFQQQFNLLNGVLISDYGMEYDDDMKKLSEEELNELVKALAHKLSEEKKNDEKSSDNENKDKEEPIDGTNENDK